MKTRRKSQTQAERLQETSDKLGFSRAAVEQGFCQNPACGRPRGAWDPHHVVAKQELNHRHLWLWDPHNALRVCRDCHFAHEWSATFDLPLTCLTDDNLAYAFTTLGAYAWDYLHRHYAGADPRMDRYLEMIEDATT